MTEPRPDSALADIVVADFSQGEAASAASFVLAQLGATVVTVESPSGSPMRHLAESYPKPEVMWASSHANKKSFAVDATTDAGRAALVRLVERADVLIDDGGTDMTKLHLDYDDVRKMVPSLVYGSIRPWMAGTIFEQVPATEFLKQAAGGLSANTGEPDGPPLRSGPHYVAQLSGMELAIGVLAALFDARRTGRGQHVLVVEQEVALSMLVGKLREGVEPEQTRFGNAVASGRSGRGTPSKAFATRPFGRNDYCYIHVLDTVGTQFAALLRGIGREDLIADPDFATPKGRREHVQAINALVGEWTAARTKAEAMAALGDAGVPIGMVCSTSEILATDHVVESGMLAPIDDARQLLVPTLPIRLSASPRRFRRGPGLGENNADVQRLIDEVPQIRRPVAAAATSKGPLDGIVVCDFTVALAGPAGTYPLAQLGARVIKIERPKDPERLIPFAIGGGSGGRDELSFAMTNGGKESITVDLRTPGGKTLIKRLIERSDVVAENFGPGSMERLGLDTDTVRRMNPRAILASLKGFTPGTPWENILAYDPMGKATSGIMSITGHADGPPLRPGPSLGDLGTGLAFAIGILAGLVQRQRTDQGQRVFTSMLDVSIHFARDAYAATVATGLTPARNGNLDPDPHVRSFTDALRCLGDQMNDFCVVEIRDDADWHALLGTTGLQTLGEDPRFATVQLRHINATALHDALALWFVTRTKFDAMRALVRAGVPSSAVVAPVDVMRDRALWGQSAFVDVTKSDGTEVKMLGWPVRLSRCDRSLPLAPSLGRETRTVLSDLLGYRDEEIEQLRGAEVI